MGHYTLQLFFIINNPLMKLTRDSIEWSIIHLNKENDTDIFPKPFEIDIINENKDYCIDELCKIDIGQYKWHLTRRFLIPKDELSYRVITQLDPIDSVFLSALIKEYGSRIESKRIPEADKIVFGNRFYPTSEGYLYKADGQWKKFWEASKEKAAKYKYVIRFDIADFYNQIYHHTIENQLIECGFPNEVKKSICSLLNTVTLKVSRGIPVGPHSTHLIAEAALIPIDNSLKYNGIDYCRYMDDFIAFCNTELDCRIILNKVADIIDKQERLILQRYKTKIFTSIDFLEECNSQLNYEPLNDIEEKIVEIINAHLDGGPYTKKIKWEELGDEDKDFFSKMYFDQIIEGYLNDGMTPNYPKLKWFYHRLTQLGVPLVIDYTLEHISDLMPIINDICEYFVAAAPNYVGELKIKGNELHKLLDSDLIKSSEYFQIALINLFSRTTELNHFERFACKFHSYSEPAKRKILFVANSIKAADWIRENKEKYNEFSPWSKRAFLISCSCLPKDERKYFFETANMFLNENDIIEKLIIKWAKDR